MRRRWTLLLANLRMSYRRDVAYFAENWSNVLSTVFYTVTQLVFIEILFQNVDSIASFSKNDMFFFLFVAQIHFYMSSVISFTPSGRLSDDINLGTLDFSLIRPVPLQWYLFTRNISWLRMIRDSIPPLLPVVLIINWSALPITGTTLIAGASVVLMGFIIVDVFTKMLAYTGFWTGSQSQLILAYYWTQHTKLETPFPNMPAWFKGITFILMPSYIPSALATAVFLGYSSASKWVTITALFTLFCIVINQVVWRAALRQYASASS